MPYYLFFYVVEIDSINLTKCLKFLKIGIINIFILSRINDLKNFQEYSNNNTMQLRVYQTNIKDISNFIMSDSFAEYNNHSLYILYYTKGLHL